MDRIAFSNMKYHKSKNILIGIAIFLTTLLLFLVPTIGIDLINGQKAAINELYPTWHALFRRGWNMQTFSNGNLNLFYHIFSNEKYNADVEQTLKEIVKENGRIEMETWKTFYDDWNSGMTLTRGACYVFLGILGAICIMNMINTMIHSVHIRKKEIGMLQAVGISGIIIIR